MTHEIESIVRPSIEKRESEIFWEEINSKRGFPGSSAINNLPAMQTTQETPPVWSLGMEALLQEVMATHSNILAWRLPCIEEPGGLQSASHRVGYDWSDWARRQHESSKWRLTEWVQNLHQIEDGRDELVVLQAKRIIRWEGQEIQECAG